MGGGAAGGGVAVEEMCEPVQIQRNVFHVELPPPVSIENNAFGSDLDAEGPPRFDWRFGIFCCEGK